MIEPPRSRSRRTGRARSITRRQEPRNQARRPHRRDDRRLAQPAEPLDRRQADPARRHPHPDPHPRRPDRRHQPCPEDARLPIAGADRLTLTEHIAVMDLMALGRVMLLPEDDLSLAAVLKSPLIGLDEDQLFALAHGRGKRPCGGARRAAWPTLRRSFAARGRSSTPGAGGRLSRPLRLLRPYPCRQDMAAVRSCAGSAGGGGRARRVPRPGARLRAGPHAVAAGLPRLARRGRDPRSAATPTRSATRCG